MPLAWDFDSSCLENLAIFTVPMKAHTETPDVPLLGPCDSAWVDSHLTIFAIPEHILMFRTHNTWIVILTWWCDDHGTTGVTLLLRRKSFRTLVRRGARIVAPLKRAVIATRIAVHPITIVTFFKVKLMIASSTRWTLRVCYPSFEIMNFYCFSVFIVKSLKSG